jgi:ComF family protein
MPWMATVAEVHGLLAHRCAVCGGSGQSQGFCQACYRALPRVDRPCPVCGIGSHEATDQHPDWHLARVIAPFQYAFPVRQIVQRLKYRRQQPLGYRLGLLLAEHLPRHHLSGVVLVAMPLHRSRLIERGYNQSFELARGVAAVLGVPIRVSGILRQRPTLPQAGLTRDARRGNVQNAFRVTRGLAGRHIWLVDDVITTGATANSLAAAMLTAGAHEVSLMAVARG